MKKVPWSNNWLWLCDENKCNGFLILHHFDFESYTVNTSSKEMTSIIKFKGDSKNIKKNITSKKMIFLIYVHRKLIFSPMHFNRYDEEVMVTLPKNSYGYFTSKYKTDEIE